MKAVNWIAAGAVAACLAGCGAEEIASPGSGGNITINNPPANPPVDPPDPSDDLVEPAGGCPTITDPAGLRDDGTITGPTGTYRVCAMPARFTVSSTLERIPGLLYSLDGRVDVGNDLGPSGGTGITLTIRPGVVVFAQSGISWLAVNRGNRINASGTQAQPIVFTSRDNVLGISTDSSHQQWGGVVLLGRAPITDCSVGGPPPSDTCWRDTEGAAQPALFGGASPADNSGTMQYVQIRYSGYVLSGNSELQSLTMGGVGSGTTIRYIHSHNSSDDAFENFGGTVDMRYLVLTGADDDNVDVDTGYTGTIQYVIGVQKASGGDSMIELDSGNAFESQTPRTYLKLANFTFVHRNPASGNGAALRFRGVADAALVNGVMTTPMSCLTLEKPEILVANAGIQKVGPPSFRSVVMQCGGTPLFKGLSGLTDGQVAAAFADPANTNSSAAFTASLTNVFVNGANETGVTATDPKVVDARFDTTNYIGAVRNATDNWYAEWTCNSATANFGSASSACTSLPSLHD
jgi:hypothetical protein